jgi:PAS domain S-box-containing protein
MSDNTQSSSETAYTERYRKIFEHSNDAVMVVDFESESFVDVNPEACEMLGYSKEALLDLDPGEIHPDDFDDVREDFIEDVLTTGSGWTDELCCITRDGEEVPTEISGAVLETGSEPPTRMVAILRDISDRVAYERQLEAEVERLERFASVLSHDLRNPLNVIEGRIDLAEETGESEHFDSVRRAAERMDALIEDMLVLAREGDAIGDTEQVDVATAAWDAWETVDTRGADLVVETEHSVDADRSRLRQLLSNLFRNAVEHGSTSPASQARQDAVEHGSTSNQAPVESDDAVEHAGSEPTVTVGDFDSGFYVADDGPGVPPTERDAVFEWGESENDTGTGIGLPLVREIARGHGWSVSLVASDAGGARFEFATHR